MLWGHRSTWGHLGSQGSNLDFSLKNALSPLCYVLYHCNSCTCIRLTPLQNLLAQISIWDHRGQKVFFHQKRGDLVHPPNLTRALGKGRMSSSFFLLSFSQSASSSTCLIGILPNLVRSMYGWMATKLMGLKIHPGSFGVTGVKNVNHVKNMKTAPIQNLMVSFCRQ